MWGSQLEMTTKEKHKVLRVTQNDNQKTNARSFASRRMTFGLGGGATAGSGELGGGGEVDDGELEALGIARVHEDDGAAGDLVPGFEEKLEGGDGGVIAGDELLGKLGKGGGFRGGNLNDPEDVFEVAGVFERPDAEDAGLVEIALGGGDGSGEASALADGAADGDGGDGGDRTLGNGVAVDDDEAVVDHGDLVLEGGGVGHGHAGVVGAVLAGIEGCVVGAHDSAENGNFAVLRAGHFDEAFAAGDDLPAGGDLDGGGAVGGGVGGGLAGGGGESGRGWAHERGGRALGGRSGGRSLRGGLGRAGLRGLGRVLGGALVGALAGGLDGLRGLRSGDGGEGKGEGGDAGEGPGSARGWQAGGHGTSSKGVAGLAVPAREGT